MYIVAIIQSIGTIFPESTFFIGTIQQYKYGFNDIAFNRLHKHVCMILRLDWLKKSFNFKNMFY